MSYTIKLDGGKYTVINDPGAPLRFLHHGEPWPAVGRYNASNLERAMANRIEELETAIHCVVRGSKIAENCYADDGMVSYDEGNGVPFKDWETRLRNVLEQKS